MKKRNRAAAWLLCAVMLLGMLALGACGGGTPDTTSQETEGSGASPSPQESMDNTGNAGSGGILLANRKKAAPICIDQSSADFDGITLIADAVAGDIELITGQKPQVHHLQGAEGLPEDEVIIIAGTLKDTLIAAQGLRWEIQPSGEDSLSDQWERYQVQVVTEGSQTKIVVAGSDKRGAIYGLFYLSQDLGGVSPWVWWADAVPEQREALSFSKEDIETVSKTPSVKFRGIFLNDEAPSLSTYVSAKFGSYNYLFYANVFELILRLKGNYLWPAMWGNAFSEEGTKNWLSANDVTNQYKLSAEERNAQGSAILADHYGVVMGLSHHEPMMRAGIEWQNLQKTNPPAYSKPTKDGAELNLWNYFLNRDNIYDFWVDGFNRNKDYEKVIPIGMRGEGDSALRNPDGTPFTLAQNIELLKTVITDQKEILRSAGHENDLQALVLYKEVEKYWYGTSAVEGLNQMEELKDDIIVLCEDNNNFLRTLPTEEERDRRWGLYYHFDYVGGPRSYMWLNVTPLTRVWDNMTMAYEHQVDDLWIVNVGDLKPMELPISFFLDLAYDFETYGTSNPNATDDYTRAWVAKQFAGMHLTAEQVADVAQIVIDYVDMNGRKRPETIFANTFSTVNYNEAQIELQKALNLQADAEKYWAVFKDTEYADAFYQLVYYPAAAVSTVNQMWLYQGLNQLYAERGSALANLYADLVDEALTRDKELMTYYNQTMADGKWRGMMGQVNHTGYKQWNHESASYPEPVRVTLSASPSLIVDVQGDKAGYSEGATALPVFENTERQCYAITLSNGGSGTLDYNVEKSADWILIETGPGRLDVSKTLSVQVNWNYVTADSEGTVTLTAGGQTVTVTVTAKVIDTKGAEDMTFYMSDGAVSMMANHYADSQAAADGTVWMELEDYGKNGATMKMAPTTASFENPADAPYLEYRFHVPESGNYMLAVFVGASNNRYYSDVSLRFGAQMDGKGEIVVEDTLPGGYVSGDSNSWGESILNNGRVVTLRFELEAGFHTLRIYGVDAGLLLEKLALTAGYLKPSHFGPPETYYVGKTVIDRAMVWHTVQ